jgi:hypothetical protein
VTGGQPPQFRFELPPLNVATCRERISGWCTPREGTIGLGVKQAYSIGYDAMSPRREECSNLLVPVCLSATHVAYGSIRMEPVCMISADPPVLPPTTRSPSGPPCRRSIGHNCAMHSLPRARSSTCPSLESQHAVRPHVSRLVVMSVIVRALSSSVSRSERPGRTLRPELPVRAGVGRLQRQT